MTPKPQANKTNSQRLYGFIAEQKDKGHPVSKELRDFAHETYLEEIKKKPNKLQKLVIKIRGRLL